MRSATRAPSALKSLTTYMVNQRNKFVHQEPMNPVKLRDIGQELINSGKELKEMADRVEQRVVQQPVQQVQQQAPIQRQQWIPQAPYSPILPVKVETRGRKKGSKNKPKIAVAS